MILPCRISHTAGNFPMQVKTQKVVLPIRVTFPRKADTLLRQVTYKQVSNVVRCFAHVTFVANFSSGFAPGFHLVILVTQKEGVTLVRNKWPRQESNPGPQDVTLVTDI
jgi:hypothetical protein